MCIRDRYYNAFKNRLNEPFRTDGQRKKDPLGYIATRSNLLSIFEELISRDSVSYTHLTGAALKAYLNGVSAVRQCDGGSVIAVILLQNRVGDGAATATIVWSSEKYDYMLVDGQRYEMCIRDSPYSGRRPRPTGTPGWAWKAGRPAAA